MQLYRTWLNFEKHPWQSPVFGKFHASRPEISNTFWQAILYNTSEKSHPMVFMSIRKDLGTKCQKKSENQH